MGTRKMEDNGMGDVSQLVNYVVQPAEVGLQVAETATLGSLTAEQEWKQNHNHNGIMEEIKDKIGEYTHNSNSGMFQKMADAMKGNVDMGTLTGLAMPAEEVVVV